MIDGISRRRTFDRLRREGIRVRGDHLAMTFAGADLARPAVAFAIPRRVGGAVVRNRCRRRVRAVLDARARAGRLAAGAYLVHVQAPLEGVAPSALESDIDRVLGALAARSHG